MTKELTDHEEILAECKKLFSNNRKLIQAVAMACIWMKETKANIEAQMFANSVQREYEKAYIEDQELETAIL